jgi:hypothetical protein
MIVDKEVYNEWKILKDHGDIKRIADESGITNETIGNALKEGECSEDTYAAIAKYYSEKKERIANAYNK